MSKAAARIMIAAPKSGEGKTTVTLALLFALKAKGLRPVCFKSGPDYIDPMFHKKALGVDGGNLDLFLSDEDTVRRLLREKAQNADIALIEGAMGYYDGVGMTCRASCYHLAAATGTPVALTVSARGAAVSLAAVIKGITDFRADSGIAGVILNNCAPALYERLAPMLERETGVPLLGFLPPIGDAALKSRHLGLVTADEVGDIEEKLRRLGSAAQQYIDIGRLMDTAASASPVGGDIIPDAPSERRTTVAVAMDDAFCFYYSETIELLRRLGADIARFSPLHDGALPKDASAIYLGGGYPELYARELYENRAMRESVKAAVEGGMPCIAECGGFLYLHERLYDDNGVPYQMSGVIKGEARRGNGLSRFGYVTLSAKCDNLLCRAGESMAAHEFHYWQSEAPGESFRAQKEDGRGWDCIHASESMYAGFPHLYLAGNVAAAKRFIAAAEEYEKTRREGLSGALNRREER